MRQYTKLKHRLGVIFAVGVLFVAQRGIAAEVRLDHVSGQQGGTVILSLMIDDTPLDSGGGFSLDVDVVFDSTAISILDVLPGSLAAEADFLVPPPFAVTPSYPVVTSPFNLDIQGSFTDSNLDRLPPGGGSLVELKIQIAPSVLLGQQIPINLVYIADNTDSLAGSLFDGGITVVPLPPAVWLMLGGLGLIAGSARRRNAV